MSKKKQEYFYLSSKEEAAMKVLWDTEDALSASEIAERIPNRTWPASSIQSILKKLEQKNAVKVAAITKLGKSYGRLFRPVLSSNEYAVMQFQRYYQHEKNDCFSMLSSLLENASVDKEEAIEALQALIDEYQKKEK
jgi:predicted transcriptional regulator